MKIQIEINGSLVKKGYKVIALREGISGEIVQKVGIGEKPYILKKATKHLYLILKKIRSRMAHNETYYYVDNLVVCGSYEQYLPKDDKRFDDFNYYESEDLLLITFSFH